ncbi:MAG: TRAP transporter small permease subunit [Alphaproteobacteria bacterium]|nr:TRAP transporter small permease subunit [Alphaproteobacteria bacterium]
MTIQNVLLTVDRISAWSGKLFAWLIVALALVVGVEVFKRYILNAPTPWIFDLNSMLYGTLFMMCGAYALAQNAHVRGDFLYGSMRPRTQAGLDLALYILFFIPGIVALVYAGYGYAELSWRINEHSNVTADGPPIYHFKSFIPIAGALVLLQGFVEIVRCVVCLRTGEWPARLKDVEEIDVVGTQIANSEYVDTESREVASHSRDIEDAAKHRGSTESSPRHGGKP